VTTARPLRLLAWGVIVLVLIVFLLLVGRQVATAPLLGVLAALGVLGVGIVAVEPAVVPLIVMPVLIVSARIGAAGVELTISDAALAAALLPAILVALGGVTPPMRNALWLAGLYQAATLFTVIQNPYRENLVEWFHAGLLVGGAILVGWAVGRHGFARRGLTLLLLTGVLFALSTIAQGAMQYSTGDFGPVYTEWPFPMQKNAAGTIFALLAVVAYVHPPWMGWRRGPALWTFWLFVAAIGATQSRQAIIGLGLAVFLVVLRQSTGRRRSKSILLAIIPLLAGVSVMVQDQLKSGNEFNSVYQRVTWFEDALTVWSTEPWLGVGLRWWYTDRFPVRFQPPNAEIDTLTSAGIIGLVAFLVLLIGTLVIARRIDPAYGLVAELVLVARLAQSQFDLFWVSVQVSLPFLVLGVCLGALAHRDAEARRLSQSADRLDRAQHPAGTVA
jgi:O-antigen ligase